MTNLREAAQQALEALYEETAWFGPTPKGAAAIAALKAALAQQDEPVQEPVEPVAWMVYTESGTSAYVTDNPNDLVGAYRALALYTAPPRCPNCASLEAQNAELDRKLAELEQPVQEPVAWLYEAGADSTLHWNKPPLYGTPLYTAPPRCPNCASLEAQNTELDRKLAELEQAESAQEPVDVGLLEYRGNSVAFIHQKMTAYRTGIDAAWDAFKAKGLHPDGKTSLADMIAKYTAPPQRKPLTDEEIFAIENDIPDDVVSDRHWTIWYARAIERAHGIGEQP